MSLSSLPLEAKTNKNCSDCQLSLLTCLYIVFRVSNLSTTFLGCINLSYLLVRFNHKIAPKQCYSPVDN